MPAQNVPIRIQWFSIHKSKRSFRRYFSFLRRVRGFDIKRSAENLISQSGNQKRPTDELTVSSLIEASSTFISRNYFFYSGRRSKILTQIYEKRGGLSKTAKLSNLGD